MNVQKFGTRIVTYNLITDEIAGGANKVMMDLFNASGNDSPPIDLCLLGLYIEPKTDVAVTGVVSARFDIFKTNTAGTGGTSNSYNAPASNAINITSFDSNAASLADGHISARSAPTSGASLVNWIWSAFVFPEETNAGSVLAGKVQLLPDNPQIEPIVLHAGEGIVIKQGSVASVNSFVFKIIFGRTSVRPQ